MHRDRLATPTSPPFNAVAIRLAFLFRPKTEIQRRDEEDPIQTCAREYIVRVVRVQRTDVQGVGTPCARSIRLGSDFL